MDFNDNESPQFDFGDPREFYKLAGNRDLLTENEDLLDMSDPNSHPDWAKEINSKYGFFTEARPKLLAGNISPDADVSPNVPKIRDIPKLYQELVDLKSNRQPASKPPIEEVSTPTPSPTPIAAPTPGDPFKSPKFKDTQKSINLDSNASPFQKGDMLMDIGGPSVIIRGKNVLDSDYKGPINPFGDNYKINPLGSKELFNTFSPDQKLPVGKVVKAGPAAPYREPYPVSAPSLGEGGLIDLNDPSVVGLIPKNEVEKVKEMFPGGVYEPPKKEDTTKDTSLEDLQKKMGNLKLLQLLMEGSSELGAGISGAMSGYDVKPIKTSLFDDLSKQAEEDWSRRIKFQTIDPTSERSKAIRESVKEQAKNIDPNARLDFYDKMSEDQLKEERKYLGELAERKMTSLDRKQAFEYRQRLWEEGASERREARKERQEDRIALTNKRDFDSLPYRLENAGAPAVTRLRIRVQQADNIFATLGISPSQLKTMSPDEIERRLDDKQKLAATEAAIELNSLLGGGSSPAASTLNKLLLESGYKKGMDLASFIANKQFAINQGAFLKQILDIAARSSQMAKERIRNVEIRALSAKKHLADDPYVGAGFLNFIAKRNISLEDLDADSAKEQEERKSLGPDEVIQVHPQTGKRYIVNKKTKKVIRQVD